MDTTPTPDAEPPRYSSIAHACAVALGGALVVAAPTAYRTAKSGGSALDGLVMGAAVMLTLLLPLWWLKGKAARGFRGVVGPRIPRALGVGLGLWISLASLGLFLLAAALKAKTNHRGLGGATFGVFGVGWLVVAALLSARLVSFGRTLMQRGVSQQLIRGGAALVIAMPVGLMLAAMALAGNTGQVLAATFDLALLWLVVLLALLRPVPATLLRWARYVALPLAVVVLLVGWLRVELSGSVSAVKRGGGLVASVLSALEMWSDRDGDGRGAHFGGADCDEGDPTRFPGARETVGDGVDSDCDGADPPSKLANLVITPDRAAPGGSQAAPSPQPNSSATGATSAVTSPAPAASDGAPASSAPATAPAATAGDPARALDKPDIILITLDTVRADFTSLYGYEKKTTPKLDRFAERAVVFEHTYAIGSSTQRALMPIVSGSTLSDTPRSRRTWPRIKEEADTVAERLKRAGYNTAAVSSFTWLRKDRGFDQGFDHFVERPFRTNHPERKTTGKLAVDDALKLYRKLSEGEKPLYLWLHMFDAHSKYLRHDGFDFGRGEKGAYLSEIGFLDDQLGRLFEAVQQHQRNKRTVWIIHGSHGEGFGEHDRKGHGSWLYEEMIRVPLLIAMPGGTAKRYTLDAVSTLDVPVTLLDLADAPRTSLPGVSLRAQAQGELSATRAPVWAHARRRTALIDWPLKLRVFERGSGKARLLLFDLDKDPKEQHDLSADRNDDLKRMDRLYRSNK